MNKRADPKPFIQGDWISIQNELKIKYVPLAKDFDHRSICQLADIKSQKLLFVKNYGGFVDNKVFQIKFKIKGNKAIHKMIRILGKQ